MEYWSDGVMEYWFLKKRTIALPNKSERYIAHRGKLKSRVGIAHLGNLKKKDRSLKNTQG